MSFGLRGIKLKVTVSIVLAVVASAVALTIVTNVLVSLTSELSLKERASQTLRILDQSLARQTKNRVARVEVLCQVAEFQQAVQWQTVDEAKRLLAELREATNARVATVFNVKGEIIADSADSEVTGALLSKSSSLAESHRSVKTAVAMEVMGDRVMVVVSTPVIFAGQTSGFLSLGSLIDEKALGELKDITAADLQLVQGGRVHASTLRLDSEGGLAAIEQELATKDSLIALTTLFSGGKRLFASAMPLRSGGKTQAVLIFSLSSKEADAIRQRVTRAALGLASIITVLAGLIGLVVARRISDPIVEIEQSFSHIAASGDLSQRITKTYDDEVGRMADSFNRMQNQIEGLHHQVASAERRMRSELQVAATVQEMLFPRTAVEGARCNFASYAQTSTEIGGDWHTMMHTPTEGNTTLIVADVTGHGAPAALVTAILHGFMSAITADLATAQNKDWEHTVTQLMNNLNKTIMESTKRSLVLSMFLLSFDHRTLIGRYLNAGHLAPVFVRTEDGKVRSGVITTPPSSLMGDVQNPNFTCGEYKFAPDEVFLIYSDGLIECTNAGEEQYGFKRLRQSLVRHASSDARSIRDAIYADMAKFIADVPPDDDITFIVAKVT